MAYQALYRKWRPKTFDSVYGQSFITETLKHEVAENKLSHAYLFCGSRGTGKTTCAKILAKAVNCENLKDGNPCLACAHCLAIEQEAALDVVEMDAASNTGVDDVRAIRENATYTPASCRYRVYIIDEVHMLSKSAFNALLKILEEPPSHVIFILATTDPESIPVTVLSRCQRFDFKRLSVEDISARLSFVSKEEGVVLEPSAGQMIARLADGGMRDALSILDQCVGVSKTVTEEITSSVTRAVGRGPSEEFALYLAKKELTAAVDLLQEMHRNSKNLLHLTKTLLSLFRLALLFTADPTAGLLQSALPDEKKTAEQLAKLLTQTEIFKILDELQQVYVRQCHSDDPKLELEMALVRLTDPRQETETQKLLSRLEKLEAAIASGISLQPAAPSATPDPVTLMEKVEEKPLPKLEETDDEILHLMSMEPPMEEEELLSVSGKVSKPSAKEETVVVPTSVAAAPAEKVEQAESVQAENLQPEEFAVAEFREELAKADPMLSSFLEPVNFTLTGATLTADASEMPFVLSLLTKEEYRVAVEKAAADIIGRKVSLSVTSAKKETSPEKSRLAKCLELAKQNGIPVDTE